MNVTDTLTVAMLTKVNDSKTVTHMSPLLWHCVFILRRFAKGLKSDDQADVSCQQQVINPSTPDKLLFIKHILHHQAVQLTNLDIP